MPAHILLADDDQDVLVVVGEVLRGAGYRVSETATREEAEAILGDGGVDLLITDSTLRGDDGRALASGADALIILTTGSPDVADQLRDRQHPFLMKPFNRMELLLFVAQVLERRRR